MVHEHDEHDEGLPRLMTLNQRVTMVTIFGLKNFLISVKVVYYNLLKFKFHVFLVVFSDRVTIFGSPFIESY